MESKLDCLAEREPALALAAANKLFDDALQSARHIMYRLNVQQGGYDYLSPFFETLTGYLLSEFKQITIQQLPDYFHPDDRNRIFGKNGELARACKSLVGNKSFLLVEYRLRKADGSYCWLRDQSTLYFGTDGQIESIVGTAYDITEQKLAESRLLKSEETFRTLFSTMQEGFAYHEVICNDRGEVTDYRYLDINPAFERLTGLQREKTIGRTVREVIPSIEEHWIADFGRVALTGKAAEIENYVEELDRYYRARAYSPERGKFAVVFTEITEQKKLTRALQEHEAELRVLFESSQAGIILVDPSGILTVANQRMAEMFGYSMAELTGTPYPSLVHPEQRSSGEELMRKLLTGEVDHVTIERRYLRKDGTEFWGYLSGRRKEDEEGRLISLVGHITDITELKQSEEALKSSESKFRTLVECSNDVIFVLDANGVFRFASPAWEKHFGFPVDVIIGREFAPFVHPDDALLCAEHLQQVLTTGQGGTSPPYRVKHADGSWRHFIANGTPYTDISGAIRYLGIARDFTEQKQAEEERLNLERQLLNAQKLESLGVLAGGIAHDFNNILTAIMGNISYARMELKPSQHAYEPLARAEKAAKRAAGLAKQLLVFAKGGEPVKKLISLQQTVHDAVSLVLSGSSVEAVTDLPVDLHTVNADEGQMSQAFHNIIINAVQAMPDGGRLTVSGKNVALSEGNSLDLAAGDYVKISFTDTGCGIAAEDMGKIFDPYFTNKTGGSGLGLASTYTIIIKHAGQIAVSSSPGRGTTFTIFLPSCDEPVNEEFLPLPATESVQQVFSILVMDDDEMVRELATITLKRFGYRVTCCDNGAAAVALYRIAREEGMPFSLVIMDLTIPGGMGGVEAARQILAFAPEAKLIVSSGYSDDPVMANFSDYGFCASLEKPYNVEEIARILQQTKQAGATAEVPAIR